MDTLNIQPNEVKLTANVQGVALTAQSSENLLTVSPNEIPLNLQPSEIALNLQPAEVVLNALTGAIINNYGSSSIVVGEIPNGTINGSNATFTTDYDFVPESVLVFRNGLAQHNSTHYTTTGTTTINLNFSPIVGDVLTVNYTKA